MMPRWMRVVRGMVGTGLTFAAGVGVVGTIATTIALVAGGISRHGMIEVVSKTTVASFILGVAFSGALALTARGRSFDKLSLPFVTKLGAGGGLLYFLAIGINNGFKVWSMPTAILNFVLLLAMGSGAAAATLLVARRARRALNSGDEVHSLGEGSIEVPLSQREAERTSRL